MTPNLTGEGVVVKKFLNIRKSWEPGMFWNCQVVKLSSLILGTCRTTCFHVYPQKCQVVKFDPWDMLNNFCFHVYAQKSVFLPLFKKNPVRTGQNYQHLRLPRPNNTLGIGWIMFEVSPTIVVACDESLSLVTTWFFKLFRKYFMCGWDILCLPFHIMSSHSLTVINSYTYSFAGIVYWLGQPKIIVLLQTWLFF